MMLKSFSLNSRWLARCGPLFLQLAKTEFDHFQLLHRQSPGLPLREQQQPLGPQPSVRAPQQRGALIKHRSHCRSGTVVRLARGGRVFPFKPKNRFFFRKLKVAN